MPADRSTNGEVTALAGGCQDDPVPTALELPRLQDAPLVLRAFSAADAPLVVEASVDPLIPLITTVPATADPAAVQAFINRQRERARSGQGYSFAIADAATDIGLGQIGLWPQSHGRASIGYAWGLTLPGLHRLELYVEPWNEGSWRAAEEAGYTREGLLRSWEQVGDQRRDMYMYSRLPTDAPRAQTGPTEDR